MHAYMIEEMADAISRKLPIDNNKVLLVLHHYWEDKNSCESLNRL
jgi:phosphoketolase